MIKKTNGNRNTFIILPIDREPQPEKPLDLHSKMIAELNMRLSTSHAIEQVKKYPKLRRLYPELVLHDVSLNMIL